MNELRRCKNCGKPINKDQQQNFFSLCYECFRRFKSSKMNQGTAMQVIGSIALPFVLTYLIIFYLYSVGYYRLPGRIISFPIALGIPLALIIVGTKKKRKWKTYLGQKPITEQQEIITTTSTSTTPVHPKFCPECGSKIGDINQKFCVSCGKEL